MFITVDELTINTDHITHYYHLRNNHQVTIYQQESEAGDHFTLRGEQARAFVNAMRLGTPHIDAISLLDAMESARVDALLAQQSTEGTTTDR